MKRMILPLSLVVVVGTVASQAPVVADPGHRRPTITVMRFADPPLTAEPGDECEGPGTCHEEHLIIKAHDPDSSITEIQVLIEGEGDTGMFISGHTYCVQGKADGTVARFKIPVTFTDPGDYSVAATAYSHKRCKPHEKGDGHANLHSRTKRLEVTVEAPE